MLTPYLETPQLQFGAQAVADADLSTALGTKIKS